jgi:hypothetical protein
MTETPTPMTPEQAQERARAILGPCICTPDFTERGRIAPDCTPCNFADEVAAALLSVHNEAVGRCAEVAETAAARWTETRDNCTGTTARAAALVASGEARAIATSIRSALKVETKP